MNSTCHIEGYQVYICSHFEGLYLDIAGKKGEARFSISPKLKLEHSDGLSIDELHFIQKQLEKNDAKIIDEWVSSLGSLSVA